MEVRGGRVVNQGGMRSHRLLNNYWGLPSASTPTLHSYTKFLVDRNGVACKRFKPGFNPLDFEAGEWLAGEACTCVRVWLCE